MWDKSKHPRDAKGRFCFAYSSWRTRSEMEEIRRLEQKYTSQSLFPSTIPLPDEQLPRSVGAKWANYEITMPDGDVAHFVEGTKLQDKEAFAGKGCKTKIRSRFLLTENYPGSNPDMWRKVKAKAQIILNNGEVLAAEIHWYEEPTIGKVEFKYKKQL